MRGFSRAGACARAPSRRQLLLESLHQRALASFHSIQGIAKTMATAKKSTATPAKKAAAPAAKKATASGAKGTAASKAAVPALKPVKDPFTKTSLVAYLAENSGVEPKNVRAVLASLENAILASVHKKGSGEFTFPGLLKIGLQQVPAKKKRFAKDPFTGEERWFAAKPASTKIKTRPLKKLKDATL